MQRPASLRKTDAELKPWPLDQSRVGTTIQLEVLP